MDWRHLTKEYYQLLGPYTRAIDLYGMELGQNELIEVAWIQSGFKRHWLRQSSLAIRGS